MRYQHQISWSNLPEEREKEEKKYTRYDSYLVSHLLLGVLYLFLLLMYQVPLSVLYNDQFDICWSIWRYTIYIGLCDCVIACYISIFVNLRLSLVSN